MLYLIGLGLGDAADITVKGLQAVRSCSRVYLEAYTSVLTVGKEALHQLWYSRVRNLNFACELPGPQEEYYGKQLILADRELVEQGADEILKDADVTDVAFLVVGDPFGATTHSDLVLRAVQAGIPYRVIHNASIMNAIGCCGLQLYNFGETVSLVFWTETWRPESYYDKICKNRAAGLHTLCLLDIKLKEQSVENMMRGKKIFEPPRFMTVSQAADQLIQIIRKRRDEGAELGLTEDTVCVGVARLGADDQVIRTATLRQLVSCDLGLPLHSLVVTGQLHPLEVDMLRLNAEPGALQHLRTVDSSTYTS
ncbi:diphthine methyl ester synthase isoform X1 [Mastacembelus armatus]|uniref:diphthine methyl ester synthase isoform X1 n=1 Tax=Mastacembelus armatus TaxID=205130 RepID=UPI000E45D1BB|nr:diphthine methyl ester synthase isoform X1 [Mastacembelus armatus]